MRVNVMDMESADNYIITPEELPNSIIVMNIGSSDEDMTKVAIESAFAQYGSINRIIFQSETNSDESAQHALLIFNSESSASAALAHNGQEILGSPITVMLASSIAVYASPDADIQARCPPALEPIAQKVQSWAASGRPWRRIVHDSFVEILSTGYLLGVKGSAYVSHVNNQAGFSEKFRQFSSRAMVRTKALDERYKVSNTVTSGIGVAKAKAKEVDQRFAISEKAVKITSATVEGTKKLANKAMENRHVSTAVNSAQSFFAQAALAVKQVAGQVKTDFSIMENKYDNESHIQQGFTPLNQSPVDEDSVGTNPIHVDDATNLPQDSANAQSSLPFSVEDEDDRTPAVTHPGLENVPLTSVSNDSFRSADETEHLASPSNVPIISSEDPADEHEPFIPK